MRRTMRGPPQVRKLLSSGGHAEGVGVCEDAMCAPASIHEARKL